MNHKQTLDNIFSKSIEFLKNVNISPNSCLIFDIDGTIIDYNGNIIEPIMGILIYAQRSGIKIILITSRLANNYSMEYTKNQLDRLNIKYTSLYMKKNITIDDYDYKRASRKSVKDRGFVTLMSFGDNLWDVYDYKNTTKAEFSGIPVIIPH